MNAQDARTATARFGELGRSFGVLLPAGRRYRKRLGLSLADQYLIEQLLYYYRHAGVWPSVSQNALANDLGIKRPTVSGQLQRLRTYGLVATRPDPRHGTHMSKTLRYCLDPYLASLAMLEGVAHYERVFWAEGNDRLLQFGIAAERGEWVWGIDGFRTPPRPAAEVLDLFVRERGLSWTWTSAAVTAEQFISEPAETELLVPPTQLENHIELIHEQLLKTRELKTQYSNIPTHEQLKKTSDHKPTTLIHEPLKTSVGNKPTSGSLPRLPGTGGTK